MHTDHSIDLEFPVLGQELPVDHGYALYGALCNIMPSLHERKDVLLHPVTGRYMGHGRLALGHFSRLTIRTREGRILPWLSLTGAKIDVDGQTLALGAPTAKRLVPAAMVRAAFVTTRNGLEPDRFMEEAGRQMAERRVVGDMRLLSRKTMTIKGRKIVGFELVVFNLDADSSLRLQEEGLGGRRKMGGGFFLPFSPWR